MAKRRRRRVVAITLSVLAATLLSMFAWLLRDPEPRFAARRSSLASIHEAPPIPDGDSQLQSVRLVARSGLAVDLTIRRHGGDATQRLPLVVLLGGHLTGADAARRVGETPGLVVAALSYPFEGDPRPSAATFLREIPKIRSAFLDTPPALSLALDYLLTRPGVDPQHVEAVGVSLGAPFVTIAGALDSRIHRIWVVHGSGGSYAPLEASMRRTIGIAPLRAVAAGIANIILSGPRLAPERWVARISPRPFMMLNALEDERLPRAAVDELFRAAREPKEQLWMDGAHVHGDSQTIQRLVGIVMARIKAGIASHGASR